MSTNPPAVPETTAPPTAAATVPQPVAPAWHTVLFLAVLVLFAALSAQRQERMIERQGRLIIYGMTLAWEWILVGYVLWGTRKRNVRLRELAGGRWTTPEDVLIDIAIAFGFWLLAAGALAGLSYALGLSSPSQLAQAKKQILPLLPKTGTELGVWLALSATAGFCEELLFRGYLQKQFSAATRSAAAGILLQAAVFGVAHAYQGGRRIVLIGVYGLMFGLLAAWRKSVRPGMIAHTLQDSFSGIAFRLLK